MDNLANKYKRVMLSSLVKVFVKTAIIQELYSIFPIISKIRFEFNLFFVHLENLIRQKYVSKILSIIQVYFQQQEIDELIKSSIIETIDILGNLQIDKISVKDELLNSFKMFNCESYIENKILNSEKYVFNSFYFEKFFKLTDSVEVIANPTVYELILLQRDSKYKNIVSIDDMKEFIQTSVIFPNEFAKIISKIELGIRLIFLPNINLLLSELNTLKLDKKLEQKINLIQGPFEEDGPVLTFHPLLVAETTRELNLNVTELSNYLNAGAAIINFDINGLKKQLTETLDFKKIFEYAFPIQSFELVLVYDLLNQYKLLNQIYIDNQVFSNFGDTLIKVIDHLANAENPNKL